MTFLEKAKIDYPNRKFPDDCVGIGCPSQYNYEETCECNYQCKDCWNREMPNTEAKALPKTLAEHDEEMRNQGYNKGLNDAWELARKIFTFNCNEMNNIFGFREKRYVFDELDAQEAIAKLKAYEEAQIEVGDVVFCSSVAEDDNDTEKKDNYGVVTGIYRDHYEILMKNGDTTGFKKETCKKTGKHIDIQSILESIGE